MGCRVGINGFGRIGRLVLRRSLERSGVEVVGVNDLADVGNLAYLLKYDSVHGVLEQKVSQDGQLVQVDGRSIRFFSERDPGRIPWDSIALT